MPVLGNALIANHGHLRKFIPEVPRVHLIRLVYRISFMMDVIHDKYHVVFIIGPVKEVRKAEAMIRGRFLDM
ncbi:unnamed protein product [Sphenostylis stenocarpa]|uniref:Uncharacterized protein n=1 Tax=Sphenostylis stenocarpa TaxID=92480 RepID=A0AA86VV04_9FABA|nr:unnamed protein product [Sphenostylis stenocarpa]